MFRKPIVMAIVAAGLAGSVALAQPAQAPGPEDRHMQSDHGSRHRHSCSEMFARSAGRRAYLEARLDLTPAQRPLWDKWQEAVKSGAAKQRDLCRQHEGQAEPATIVERQAHFAALTATRAEALQAAQPALVALYEALSPEQRQVLDRPPGHGHRHR